MPARLLLVGVGAKPDVTSAIGEFRVEAREGGYAIELAVSGLPSLSKIQLGAMFVQLGTKSRRWHYLELESPEGQVRERVLITPEKLVQVGLGEDHGGSVHATVLGMAARPKHRRSERELAIPLLVTGLFLHAEIPEHFGALSIPGVPSLLLMKNDERGRIIPKLPLVMLDEHPQRGVTQPRYLKPACWLEIELYLRWALELRYPLAVGTTTLAHNKSGDLLKDGAHSPLHAFDPGEIEALLASNGKNFSSLAGLSVYLCQPDH